VADRNTEPMQLFPALDRATEAALRASIQKWGVLVPVAMDQHGRIIDGHHRSRIADELGIDYHVITHDIANDADAEELARTLNLDRRHLEVDQRRELVAHLRSEGHSYRAIGEALGVSQMQAHRDAAGVTDVTAQPDRVIGRDGKSYPTSAPASPPPRPPSPPLSVRSFTEDEVTLKWQVSQGETIVVNMRADGPHASLVPWLKEQGLLVKIDRTGPWGNPFVMDADGSRDDVIKAFEKYYLPHKPSLLDRIDELKGKALGCWCAPEPCHGHVLKAEVDER
jgi:DNA-binding CsgD family transcriptional regulator